MPSDSGEAWRWKLRLFASADLVGSTAFKAQQTNTRSPDWVPTFTEFFRDFPAEVQAQYATLPTLPAHCGVVAEQLRPWKFLGDEILFWVELGRHEDAASHLLAFKRAVREFPKKWQTKKLALRLKGAAWLAGFPITNREILIPAAGGEPIQDYIGPSIDLGFRVAKFADERRFTMSADLALMLLDGVHRLEWEKEEFFLVLHGREVLKGVIGNESYPIVFLHTSDGKPDHEERLLGVEHRCDLTA
jgi:hypothetical protein